MGYSPMIKVLSIETLMDQLTQAQLAQPQPQAQPIIHVIDPEIVSPSTALA